MIVVFPDHAHIFFYSCEALSQQAGSHYFLFNLCFFLKLSSMSVEIKPCNCLYYDIILTFYVINRPEAYFCMSLSILTGATVYLAPLDSFPPPPPPTQVKIYVCYFVIFLYHFNEFRSYSSLKVRNWCLWG